MSNKNWNMLKKDLHICVKLELMYRGVQYFFYCKREARGGPFNYSHEFFDESRVNVGSISRSIIRPR